MSNLPNHRCWALSIALVLLLSAPGLSQEPTAEGEQAVDGEKLFQDQVRPILEEHCWDCHGPDTQESGLRLDTLAGWQAGGHSGKSLIVTEQPGSSYIIEALNHTGDIAMPPDDKLPDEMIASITKWIGLGMPWPGSPTGSSTDAAANRPLTKEEQLAKPRAEHWAFQPLSAPALPAVTREDWIAQPLDRFILARLESHSLSPSPEADKYTLIRRLKFDLLGLPPAQEEVQAFLSDDSPQAYERLVDRFLSSPQYGERWGRHWLDVARYADTRGYAFAQERRYPYAYTYRDYVIKALNEDLPFDRFVLEQLAADLLSLDPHDPALAALGFLTVGRKFNNRHLDIDDQIDVVGRGLLGLTVSCARCHDHKYDPIPTQDYYSLYGVFASSHEPEDLPTIGDPTRTPGYDEFQRELAKLQSELAAFVERKRDEITTSAQQHATDYFVRALAKDPEESLSQLPFIALKGEDFKPHLVRRWQETLARDAKADHPVWGPLADLALLPDNEFADKSVAILDRWKSVPAGTATGQLNPLVQAALAGEFDPVENRPGASLRPALLRNTRRGEVTIRATDSGAASTDLPVAGRARIVNRHPRGCRTQLADAGRRQRVPGTATQDPGLSGRRAGRAATSHDRARKRDTSQSPRVHSRQPQSPRRGSAPTVPQCRRRARSPTVQDGKRSTGTRPSDPGTRESADGARPRQSRLDAPFRQSPGEHSQRLRRAKRSAGSGRHIGLPRRAVA